MKLRGFAAALVAGAGVLGAFATGAAAQDDNVFKLAFVAFLSGPAAELFGKPAVQGAKTVIDALNAGSLPKPYDKVGFGGLKIEIQLIDEAGGATKQVEELRNAFERDHVDAVLGYVSSGDCLAVSPAAEELKKLLVLFDCGTPRRGFANGGGRGFGNRRRRGAKPRLHRKSLGATSSRPADFSGGDEVPNVAAVNPAARPETSAPTQQPAAARSGGDEVPTSAAPAAVPAAPDTSPSKPAATEGSEAPANAVATPAAPRLQRRSTRSWSSCANSPAASSIA